MIGLLLRDCFGVESKDIDEKDRAVGESVDIGCYPLLLQLIAIEFHDNSN